MRAIYKYFLWTYFRLYCWFWGYNGIRTTHRVDIPNVGLLAELWHGYYPYLDKVLMGHSWEKHCDGPDKFYYILQLTWGPIKSDPYQGTRRTIKESELTDFSDNMISVVAVKV